MKEAIKLTGITGQAIYIHSLFNVQAVADCVDGDQKYTMVALPGIQFRVKESATDIATLLGWEPKLVEDTKEKKS